MLDQPTINISSSTEVQNSDRLFTLATFMEFYNGFNWLGVQDYRDKADEGFKINRRLSDSEFTYLKAQYLMFGQKHFELFYSQYANGQDLEFFDSALRFLTSKEDYSDDLINSIVRKNPDTPFSDLILKFKKQDSKKRVKRAIEKNVDYFYSYRQRVLSDLQSLTTQLEVVESDLKSIENDEEKMNLALRRLFILDMIEVLYGFYKFFEVNVFGLNFLNAFYKQKEMFSLEFDAIAKDFPDLLGIYDDQDKDADDKRKYCQENPEYLDQIQVIYFWRKLKESYENLPREIKTFFKESEICLFKNAAVAHLKAGLGLKDSRFADLRKYLMDQAKTLNEEADSLYKVQESHRVAKQEMVTKDAANPTQIDFARHKKVIARMTDKEWIISTRSYQSALRATFILNRVITSNKMPSAEKDKYQNELDDIISFYKSQLEEFKSSQVILFSQQSDAKIFIEHATTCLNAAATFYFSRSVTEHKRDVKKQSETFEKIVNILTIFNQVLNTFTSQQLKLKVSSTLNFLNPEQYKNHTLPQVVKIECLLRAQKINFTNGLSQVVSASSMENGMISLIHFFTSQMLMIKAQVFDKIIERDYFAAKGEPRDEIAKNLIAEEEAEKKKRSSELDKFVSKIQEDRERRGLKESSKKIDKKQEEETQSLSSSVDVEQSNSTEKVETNEEESLLKIYLSAGEALFKPNFEEHAMNQYDELYRRSCVQENKLMQAMALNGKAEVLFRAASIFLIKFNSKDFVSKIEQCKKLTQEAIDRLNQINVLLLSKEEAAMFAKFSNSMEMNVLEIEQTVSFMKLKFQQWEELERKEYENFKNSPRYNKGNKSDPSPRAAMRKVISECFTDLSSVDSSDFKRQNRALCALNTQLLPLSNTVGVDFGTIRSREEGKWTSTTATAAFSGIARNPYALKEDIEHSASVLFNGIKTGRVEIPSKQRT